MSGCRPGFIEEVTLRNRSSGSSESVVLCGDRATATFEDICNRAIPALFCACWYAKRVRNVAHIGRPKRWSSWRRSLGRSRLRGWRDVTKNFAVPAHSNVAHAWRLGARSRRNGAWRRRSEQWIGLRPPAIVELRSHVEHGSDPVRPASQSDALAQPRQITAAASPSQPIALQTPRLQISISAPRFGRPNSCRFCISYIQTGRCERTTPPRGI
jgi:hypothetical protein